MPTMFMAVSSKFVIKSCEGESTPAARLEGAYRKFIDLNIFQPETPNVSLKFEVSEDEIQDGIFEIKTVGDEVYVNCDFIAKINVKANYVDSFLDPNSKWVLGSVSDIVGEVEGLITEEYEVKSFRGTSKQIHFLMTTKTAKNVKNLK